MVKDIIHLNNYMYVVDKETDISIGDYYLISEYSDTFQNPTLTKCDKREEALRVNVKFREVSYKILASTDPSLGLPLLPEIEEECNLCEGLGYYCDFKSECPMCNGLGKLVKAKMYTEDDIRTAIRNVFTSLNDEQFNEIKMKEEYGIHKERSIDIWTDKYLQSLNPLPIAVEVEMVEGKLGKHISDKEITQRTLSVLQGKGETIHPFDTIKVVNNIVQVKRWIYEKEIQG